LGVDAADASARVTMVRRERATRERMDWWPTYPGAHCGPRAGPLFREATGL